MVKYFWVLSKSFDIIHCSNKLIHENKIYEIFHNLQIEKLTRKENIFLLYLRPHFQTSPLKFIAMTTSSYLLTTGTQIKFNSFFRLSLAIVINKYASISDCLALKQNFLLSFLKWQNFMDCESLFIFRVYAGENICKNHDKFRAIRG
jgi:hypothetical protein